MKTILIAVAGALTMVLSSGAAAYAAEDSGRLNCDEPGYTVHVRNYGTGTLANYTPENRLAGSIYSVTTTIYRTGSAFPNAFWRATTSGYQNTAGTYGYCD